MKLFTFLNYGEEVTTEFIGEYVRIDLDACTTVESAGAISQYVSLYRFIHKVNQKRYEYNVSHILIPANLYDTMNFEISGDVQPLMKGNAARCPGYLIRGRKLSEEQAFDVLAHSDEVFTTYINDTLFDCEIHKKVAPKDVHLLETVIDKERIIRTPYRHIGNKFLQTCNFPWYNGFVTPCGDVGCDWWAYKYPEYFEIFLDAWTIAERFPFMEFVVAITYWNERCSEWWDTISLSDHNPVFDVRSILGRDLQCCIYAHNGIIEIHDNLQKFDEFAAEYESPQVFEVERYYTKVRKQHPITKEFLDELVSVHHLEEAEHFNHYLNQCFASHYSKEIK